VKREKEERGVAEVGKGKKKIEMIENGGENLLNMCYSIV
jgi:hypothetical protein